MIPSTPVPNAMFSGNGNLQFENRAGQWGVAEPGFSNGAAYGDLDNDGDLDLVVNNVNMESFIYRNRAKENSPDTGSTNSLSILLKGRSPNNYGIGTRVTAWAGGRQWYLEQQPVRGFQSSVSPVLHLGLGKTQKIDSLVVEWPGGGISRLRDLSANQQVSISEPRDSVVSDQDTDNRVQTDSNRELFLEPVPASSLGLDWRHMENRYNDFARQPMLFHMRSTEGPPVCVTDINADGLDDLFIGGAKDQPASIFLQHSAGRFEHVSQPVLAEDSLSEDTECQWFDADGNGTPDLFVGSGGSEFPASSSALMDRLYLNDGSGRLKRSDTRLTPPVDGFHPAGAVAATDYDGDGDVDLFVGDRMQPFAYGRPVDGHLLVNDGSGQFQPADISGLRKLGMITDAKWHDHDGDGDPDLWVVGEWMPVTVFENNNGSLTEVTTELGLQNTGGWWKSLVFSDLDGDGDHDFVAGNHGLNTMFDAGEEYPLEMWAGDLDRNGRFDQLIAENRDQGTYPLALRDQFLEQFPRFKSENPSYTAYADMTVQDLFTDEELQQGVHHRVTQLASIVGWNTGNGEFSIDSLPKQAQLTPLYDFLSYDIDRDGVTDLLGGGNLHAVKPQAGRYDASHGVVIAGLQKQYLSSPPAGKSGFFVRGEIRQIKTIVLNDIHYILVARNDGNLKFFKPITSTQME